MTLAWYLPPARTGCSKEGTWSLRNSVTHGAFLASLLLLLAPTAYGGWQPTTKLTASDGRASDSLGYSVALDGDTLVAGARDRSEVGFASGAVFVYECDADGSWTEVKALPADLGPGDSYGQTVGLGADTLAASSPNDRPGGSLYIFYRDPEDPLRWNEIAKLKDPEGDQDDFGLVFKLDRSGQRLAVGDPYDDEAAPDAGAVHIFERAAGRADAWGWVAKLTAPDAAIANYFGGVVIDGDLLAVSATGYNGDGIDRGKAYVFERDADGIWKPTAELFPSDPEDFDRFGAPLALNGDILAIAATTKAGQDVGVVYVFERVSESWTQVARLMAPNGYQFGSALALEGTTLVVGVPEDDDLGGDAGAVYVFERNAGGPGHWGLVDKLRAPDGQTQAWFGFDVAVIGGRIAAGSPLDDHVAEEAGSAYVFDWAAPVLSLTGSCPGAMELSLTGATRKGLVALAGAQAEGSYTIPGGQCPGLVLDLDQPRLLTTAVARGNGSLTFTREIPPGACGTFLQAVDAVSCTTSNTLAIPED